MERLTPMNSSTNFGTRGDRSASTAAIAVPTVCPACQSPSIATTARKHDESAYWRCGSCGEIWNASRRGTASGGGYRWR
jgi:transposase-like protein